KEIKDIMAYLRFIYQPADRVSFERIVNVPTRGVGAKSLSNFYVWQQAAGLGLYEGLGRASECDAITPRARKGLTDLYQLVAASRELLETTPLPALLDSLIRRIDYYAYLSDGTPQGESRTENVRELLSVARSYQ